MKSKYNPTRGMSKEEMLEHWINESNKKFNNKFDYSAIKEISTKKSPIVVSCPEHGAFNTIFVVHLNSKGGCPKCGDKLCRDGKRFSFEDFMKRLDEVHPNRDYKILTRRFPENSVLQNQYVYVQDPFGICKMKARALIDRGGALPSPKTAINPQQYFINRSRVLHNYKYAYNNFVYKSVFEKSYITCPKHGDFLSHPNNHLCGRGCPKCANEGNSYNTWSLNDYKELCGDRQPILYKVRIFNEEESFIKIGITVQGVDKRFNSKFKLTGFRYEVIKTIQGDAEYIWKLEKRVHSFYKKYKYHPKTHFQGHTECFLAQHL